MEEFTEIQKEKRETQQLLKKELERLQRINADTETSVGQRGDCLEPETIIVNNVKAMCDIYNTIY